MARLRIARRTRNSEPWPFPLLPVLIHHGQVLKVRGLAAALLVVLSLLCVRLPAQQPAVRSALPYTVISRDARRPLAVRLIGGQEMFALDDLSRLFNLTVREDALAGGLTIAVGNQSIVLSPQQPLASLAGRMISLPAAPVHEGRVWYVPVDFVGRALAPVYGTRLELRKPSRLILLGDVRMPRVAARIEPIGSLTRVTFDVAPPTPHTVAQEGSRLLIRFDADALDAALPAGPSTDTVQAVHLGDTPQVVALDLGPRFASYRVADQPGTAGVARIVVDLVTQTEAPPATPPTPGTQPPAAPPAQVPVVPGEPPPLLDLPPPGGLRAIVIDPGHGGDETGAKGSQGTLEKNITLSVARRLKAALEARLGVRVLLTRDGDQTVPLDQRASLANNNKADLFISLHANASVRPGVSGAEVFFLSLDEYGDEAQRRRAGDSRRRCRCSAAALATSRSCVGDGAGAPHRAVGGVCAGDRSVAARAGPDEPAARCSRRRCACWSARTCRRCSSRWASSPTPQQETAARVRRLSRTPSCRPSSTASSDSARRRAAMPRVPSRAADARTRAAVIARASAVAGRRLASVHRPAAMVPRSKPPAARPQRPPRRHHRRRAGGPLPHAKSPRRSIYVTRRWR